MVEERKISYKRHLIAFLFTAGVFTIGLLLGLLLTKERTNYLEDIADKEKLGYESLQLQYIYLTSVAQDKNCQALISTLDQSTDNLEVSRKRLENYIADGSTTPGFELIKRNYILSELRLWLFAKTARDTCDVENVRVLYFYSNDIKDTESRTQGVILTNLKDSFKDKLLIFSLDNDFMDEPMIGILKSTYSIMDTPTIIVEDKKFIGLTTKEDLISAICSNFKVKPIECSI